MNNKKYISTGVVLLMVLVGVWFMLAPEVHESENQVAVSSAPTEEATDITSEFYKSWLVAVQSTTTDPYQAGLSTDQLLTDNVRTYLVDAQKDAEVSMIDPVLCLSFVPKRIGVKSIFASDTSAEVQVLARGNDDKASEYAVVGLIAVEGKWKIDAIACMFGESAPDREFPFDREGFLLKGVPPQLDSNFWYLVFEENGKAGHVAPLTFDSSSVCISPEGSESVCDPNQFVNPSQAHVQGGMTEAGAIVQRIQMLGEE